MLGGVKRRGGEDGENKLRRRRGNKSGRNHLHFYASPSIRLQFQLFKKAPKQHLNTGEEEWDDGGQEEEKEERGESEEKESVGHAKGTRREKMKGKG